jgi:hypothetical protein
MAKQSMILFLFTIILLVLTGVKGGNVKTCKSMKKEQACNKSTTQKGKYYCIWNKKSKKCKKGAKTKKTKVVNKPKPTYPAPKDKSSKLVNTTKRL